MSFFTMRFAKLVGRSLKAALSWRRPIIVRIHLDGGVALVHRMPVLAGWRLDLNTLICRACIDRQARPRELHARRSRHRGEKGLMGLPNTPFGVLHFVHAGWHNTSAVAVAGEGTWVAADS
jgi:hypothetical protein